MLLVITFENPMLYNILLKVSRENINNVSIILFNMNNLYSLSAKM